MSSIGVYENPELQKILDDYNSVKAKHGLHTWNITSVSSYNTQLENFHSEILASILSPVGYHDENVLYLHLFIEFLNTHYGFSIACSNYQNSWVDTEVMGRIDIGIFDRVSKKCIIIENKINDAPDMPDQLKRYYESCTGNGYEVDAIIYLSIDGKKKAPNFDGKSFEVTRSVGANFGKENDLINGWLIKCKVKSSTDDGSSFLHQYIKLIKHIDNKGNYTKMSMDFYNFVSDKENLDRIKASAQLLQNLDTFRRDEFQKQIHDYKPFESILALQSYGNRGTLFWSFTRNGNKYKLDVFFIDHITAFVRLWTPDNDGLKGLNSVQELLKELNELEEFEIERPNSPNSMMCKRFHYDQYDSIVLLDKAVLEYVNNLFGKLRNL